MVTRVSTTESYSALLAGLQSAQARQALAQTQISSGGKLGSDLKAYAAHTDTLTAARSVAARTAAYVDTGQATADRLSAQDLALNQLSDAANAARQAVTAALANGDATGLMDALQGALSQAAGALNTEYDGRRLFGGGNDQTAPVSAQTLADLTTAPVASRFQNDQRAEVSRLDDQTTARTGVLASDAGQPLLQAMADLTAFSQSPAGPFTGKLTTAQASYLQGALAGFTAAHAKTIDVVAENGAAQNRVDTAVSALKARDVQLKGMLGGLTDVDLAEAATRLQLSQVAVQAAAQVFQTLQGSSLLNVLR